MMAKKPRVVVVGAGMAGLAAAHRLHSTSAAFFDLTVVEAGDRIGGRILTGEFAGEKVEFGATWIHGIDGSPLHAIACDIGALHSDRPWERMDGFPKTPLTVAEGGFVVDDASIVEPITSLYRSLRCRDLDTTHLSLGSYLRWGLKEYQSSRGGVTAAVAGNGWTKEALEAAVFAVHENLERTRTAANDLDDVDLVAEREYKEFPGEHLTVAGGYSRIVDALLVALPPGTVQFGRRVVRIEWSPNATASDFPVHIRFEDGTAVEADHAIITVSLGVLKNSGAGGMEFAPELPAFKREAIARLGFGVMDKMYLEMERATDGRERGFPFLLTAFDEGRREERIPAWMRKTWSIWPIYGGSGVLVTWFAGVEAVEMEGLGEEEVIRGVNDTIEAFLVKKVGGADANVGGGWGSVVRMARSRWGKDPLFLGSYCYVPLGSSGDDLDVLAEPLPCAGGASKKQILFAGEATHRNYYSTTHGAHLSGIREADRLLHHYQLQGNDS